MASGNNEKMCSISRKYPTSRSMSGIFAIKSGYKWLEGKRSDDNADGLWRIHDKLYDFRPFIKSHPGGSEWLGLTDGTDITELFETYHLSMQPTSLISEYYVRDANEPRNYLLTFNGDGFYKTLQGKVFKLVRTLDRKPEKKSKIFIDMLVMTAFSFAILATYSNSYYLATASAIFLAYSTITAHNFFHLKDNWRMYYFNLSLMSYRDWRIMHAMSHHNFPNTYHDMEISMPEPYLNYLPKPKSFAQRYLSYIYAPIIFAVFSKASLMYRLLMAVSTKRRVLQFDDLIPLTLPLIMFSIGTLGIADILLMWLYIITMCSLWVGTVGINTGHHHPLNYHEGDELKSLDFGIFQIDTIIEKKDMKGSQYLVLTHFGEHILHHLFPSLDHGVLPQLNELLLETCIEFETEMRQYPWYEIFIGQYQQLARTKSMSQITKKELEKIKNAGLVM